MAVVLQSMTAVRLCSQLHRQLGEVDSTEKHQRQLAKSQRILTSWHQKPQSSAMGILFTKLWRLFNHQGKNGAVTFIMKLTKTWEISGLDGPKKARFQRQVSSVISLRNSFQDTTVCSQVLFFYHNFICCHAIFIYFYHSAYPVYICQLLFHLVNWLRMSFSINCSPCLHSLCFRLLMLSGVR